MTLYQVDAFTDHLFGGNPAAVIPLQTWLHADLMQNIAMENNLSETVFFVPLVEKRDNSEKADFEIRWFTPLVEIDLCGHATLAAAFVIFNFLHFKKDQVIFNSQSGLLKIKKKGALIEMDFPSWPPKKADTDVATFSKAIGDMEILELHQSRDMIILLRNEEAVKNCQPDYSLIKKAGYKIIITAAGDSADFVSRFFAPTAGVDEDPVTGSAHSQLIPFWSARLGKIKMNALQLSARGGRIDCALEGDRVVIGGSCVSYMKGEIESI